MNIEYVGRHVDLTDRIRSLTEERLAKAARFLVEPVEVQLTLENERHLRVAELHVTHRHGVLHAREENNDLFEAIQNASDAIEKQARRARKRSVDVRRRANRQVAAERHWPIEVLARESVDAGGAPRVIRSTRLEIKPMTLEEAASALEASRRGFVVFRDAETEQINVLYRRKDENYGLISPEL
ncbi:MAG: ribosome-associated translation inhibitor RaiA [Acidobacteria bacterium]|nr:ribosome-associated translation inhibitor RaiA [Acidobacteriota bacterium]